MASTQRRGWDWGPFTLRLPFYHTHTHLQWPEFLHGLLVATAIGLAVVPILTGYFGLSFEQAVACAVCLVCVFSLPLQKLRAGHRGLALLAVLACLLLVGREQQPAPAIAPLAETEA